MWESICLTLVATAGNNIGKVLQKKGTIILPPLSFKLKVIRAYIFNKQWIGGFLMDVIGALLMLRALSLAPVSVIQPVSGCGLAILSVFSYFYLKEVMNALDWVGIAMAGLGTIGVGIGGEEQDVDTISLFKLPLLIFIVAILFVDPPQHMATHLQTSKTRTRIGKIQSEVIEEIIFGLESGILFGMASVISKMGFIFLEQGYSKILVPLCISISICCSGTGFVYQTRGLKHGRAIVVSTCAAVASIVTGVLAGVLSLGEHLPSAPAARLALLLGWLLIIMGVILLVSSTRLAMFLPWRLRRLVVKGNERNSLLKRTGSVRSRDSGPSTVIQTTTLHHLITNPSKEKA